jgi:hypothetical protein
MLEQFLEQVKEVEAKYREELSRSNDLRPIRIIMEETEAADGPQSRKV